MNQSIRSILLSCVMGAFCALVVSLPSVPAHASEPTPSELISGAVQDVPIPGKVTMLDLGAHKCIPCKMMTPILKELAVEYEDRAAIVFIDVWENLNVTGQFGIRTIPTQIFYDAEGNEQLRHEGFLDKASIVKVLHELGVD